MSTELSHPSIHRENALNALIEIRACYGEVRTFVARAFDRLDELIEEIGASEIARGRAGVGAEDKPVHEEVDRLVRLAHELAARVAEQMQRPANDDRIQPR